MVVAGGKDMGVDYEGVASLDSLTGLIQLGNNCELAPLLMTGRRGVTSCIKIGKRVQPSLVSFGVN